MGNLLIKTTAEFLPGDGIFIPAKRFNVNERINHRGDHSMYHIFECYYSKKPQTHQQREDAYIEKCLENGVRPFNYPEHLWQEYLRDCASEEHTNRCEEKNAWMYVN